MLECNQETHKIGVLYVGPGQVNNERDILGNRYGSARYAAFLAGQTHLTIYLPTFDPDSFWTDPDPGIFP